MKSLILSLVFILNTGGFFINSNINISTKVIQKKTILQNLQSYLESYKKKLQKISKKNTSKKISNKQIIIFIKKGMSFNKVAKILAQKNIISNILSFKVLAFFLGQSKKIQSGEYIFKKNSSFIKVLNILVEGKTRLHQITFPEGYNMYEIAQILEKNNFLKAKDFISLCYNQKFIFKLLNKKVLTLEGYLFPNTYFIPKPIDPKILIRQMVQGFFTAYNKISKKGTLQAGVGFYPLTPYEVIILASIVEKETGLSTERPLIASVFFNRLQHKMRLESDPTTLYGMMIKAGGLVTLNIRKKDLLNKNLYNTYRIFGFPVSPISNPGAKALEAVFKPQKSDFFYFVSRNNGSHVFSKTYTEHKKAVNFYQK